MRALNRNCLNSYIYIYTIYKYIYIFVDSSGRPKLKDVLHRGLISCCIYIYSPHSTQPLIYPIFSSTARARMSLEIKFRPKVYNAGNANVVGWNWKIKRMSAERVCILRDQSYKMS